MSPVPLRLCLIVIAALLLAPPSAGQTSDARRGLRSDTVRVPEDRSVRLRPFILPGSVTVYHGSAPVDSSRYTVDTRFGRVSLDDSFSPSDTVVVRYRFLPLAFQDVYRHDVSVIGNQAADPKDLSRSRRETAVETGSEIDFFTSSRLTKSGSITRGVIAGNRQDATIESGLRMQLSGEIVDGVNLRAALTDENTPILPEGTTQRINEFDRVFIEVSSARASAQLGDFDLSIDGGEFAQFHRKLQGARVAARLPNDPGDVAGGSATVAGATSRGIYRSQDIQGIEGVQGPYRLEGESGERFIIVVPGTEVVYIDGRRLMRGETNDYVIDYATAEITFTPSRLITGNKRISVEFEYSTNQFTRTLMAANVSSRLGSPAGRGGRLSVTVIREADSKDFSQEFGLTSADSLLLAESGDRVAARSGAERVTYDPESPFAQYVLEPRMLSDGTVDTVFVALTAEPPPDESVYRVQFTRVGPGSGSYDRIGRSVNGILYEFRGPGLGEYEPVRILPKPRLQQVVDLAGGIRPVAGIELFGEVASSTNNENRLSSFDERDDIGHAYTFGLRTPSVRIGIGGASVSAEARRRIVEADFRSFNRIRTVEFGRRWNLDTRSAGVSGGNSLDTDETTDEVAGTVRFSENSFLRGEWGTIRFRRAFDAARRAATFEFHEDAWPVLEYQAEYITSDDRELRRQGEWIRQTGTLRYDNLVANLTPAVEVEHEDRRQRDIDADSLTGASLAFVELRPSLTMARNDLEIGTGVDLRTEEFALNGRLRNAAKGWTLRAFIRYQAGSLFSTDGDVGFRRRRFRDRFRIEQGRQNSESVVLRWKGNYRPLQRTVDASWLYEAQTERSPVLQEIYVRTGPELGQFVWTDFNGDGAIQIDEFIPETTPNEGDYVKTFVPSDTLFAVVGVQARLRLGIDPSRSWQDASGGLKRVLSQVSTRTTLEVVEKSQEQDLRHVYLLNLRRFRSPGKTLNGRLVIRQDVELFKRRSDVGLDLTFSQVRSLTDLAAGLEERFINSWKIEGRYRPVRQMTVGLATTAETSRLDSESFVSRQFDLRTLRIVPEVTFSLSRSWQLRARVEMANKEDRRFDRSARVLKVPVDMRHNLARKLQLSARVEVADVRVDGTANGFAQFELTDGRGAGTSMLWSVGAQYSINRFIRANFNYDGRSPSGAPTLHTMRMQVSAVF